MSSLLRAKVFFQPERGGPAAQALPLYYKNKTAMPQGSAAIMVSLSSTTPLNGSLTLIA
jgi:hypothetical protein